MKFQVINSPNFAKKARNLRKIKFIIIHYTGMQSKRVSIKRLISPKYKVSCHYLIDRSGGAIKFMSDQKIAWHAGKSMWKNYKNLNDNSIGIELENKGHRLGYQAFSKPQIKKLIKICNFLKRKYKIKNSCILGHSDIAPLRKKDPGEFFPWKKLSKSGIGLWYPNLRKKFIRNKNLRKNFFKNLFVIGYRYFIISNSSKSDKMIIKAFQRRFVQDSVNGKIDQKTFEISHYLARKKQIS